MSKNEIPKVTEKNTKAELMDAFNKVVSTLETKSQTVIDPAKEATQKACTNTVNKVESISTSAIQYSLDNCGKYLRELQDELSVYVDVKAAIDIKRAELKEMFDIEKSAFTLAALINTQNEVKERFDREMTEKTVLAETKLSDVVFQINQKTAEFKAEQDRLNAELKETRKKDEVEYKYSTERQRKLQEDSFQDEMSRKRKDLANEVETARLEIMAADKELNAREIALNARDAEIADMQSKISQFPTILENATKKAEEDGKKTAAASYGFETRYIKKEYEGEIALLTNKIETLNENLSAANSRNEILSDKLDEAYGRLESLATKTVDGASSAKLVSTLETALRDKGVSTGK